MVHPSELAKRDSSNSTATVSTFRSSRSHRDSNGPNDFEVPSNGSMASAAAFSRGRRNGAGLKASGSQPSLRSIASFSTVDSSRAAKKGGNGDDNNGRSSPQPRNSFGQYVDRAREVTRQHRIDSNASKRSYQSNVSAAASRASKRRNETVMQSGRHGNEWLFGGWSLRETVKGLLK